MMMMMMMMMMVIVVKYVACLCVQMYCFKNFSCSVSVERLFFKMYCLCLYDAVYCRTAFLKIN